MHHAKRTRQDWVYGWMLSGVLMSLVTVRTTTCADEPVNRGDAPNSTSQVEAVTRPRDLEPRDLEPRDLENFRQVSPRIYVGSEPASDRALAALAKLGITTIVSVDGARPHVVEASKHGLRYIHIPIGYDGIDEVARNSLVRLVRDIGGPIYIHCHHGKHRGPAAAAVACLADGTVTKAEAIAILRESGTSRDYAGLWRDVEAYQAPAPQTQLPELVATSEVPDMAAAMAKLDRMLDVLRQSQAADWKQSVDVSAFTPSQTALLLQEGLYEIVRQLGEENPFDARMLQWMSEAETRAAELHHAIAKGDRGLASTLIRAVTDDCKRCHRAYRD